MRAILCAGTILASAGLSVQLALAAQSTQVITFAPFGSSGLQSGYTVTSKVHGTCSNGSIRSPQRPDAWSCTVNNSVYEPCFSNVALSSVACPSDAFSKKVVLLILDKPLPIKKRNSEGGLYKGGPLPWALLLSNGARCYVTGGAYAPAEADTMRPNFECTTKGWVLGFPDKSKQPWQVFYSARSDGTHHERVSVRQAVV
jgi:hypothetical protein